MQHKIKPMDPQMFSKAGTKGEEYKISDFKKGYIIESPITKYKIESTLGKGAYGLVYMCINMSNNEKVAIKISKKEVLITFAGVKEVRFLTKLNRINSNLFVRLIEGFFCYGFHCIVLELLNMDLYEFLKATGLRGISHFNLKKILIQLVNALIILQKQEIIHCDLKPENILMVDESFKVKLIDFGASFDLRTNVSNFYIQSRFYRAPEVLLCIPMFSRIDVWSLGCVAFEMFMGYPIFPGQDRNDQLSRILYFFNCKSVFELIEKNAEKEEMEGLHNIHRVNHKITPPQVNSSLNQPDINLNQITPVEPTEGGVFNSTNRKYSSYNVTTENIELCNSLNKLCINKSEFIKRKFTVAVKRENKLSDVNVQPSESEVNENTSTDLQNKPPANAEPQNNQETIYQINEYKIGDQVIKQKSLKKVSFVDQPIKKRDYISVEDLKRRILEKEDCWDSIQLIDFLLKCLESSVLKRITPVKLINHPYLAREYKGEGMVDNGKKSYNRKKGM